MTLHPRRVAAWAVVIALVIVTVVACWHDNAYA
jgi:hypothetical protein